MKKGSHPKKIGPYTLLDPIGRGGMSIVYRALAPEAETIVALKLLYPLQPLADLVGMEKLKGIFTAEAAKMANLQHPHIVKILDLDLKSATPYFTMEYHCANFGTMINENFVLEKTTRIIKPKKVLDYGIQVLAGLQFIHNANIIHRDIKPHNILVTDADIAKICDFGTAILEDEEIFDSAGLKVGSPYYIAPEQEEDPENVDQRSDLYSCGVMFYRMLTGELPGVKSVRLSRINALYEKSWEDFFSKALERDPALRFQNAGEMTAALQDLELHLEKKIDATCQSVRSQKPGFTKPAKQIRSNPIRAAGIKAREAFQVNELWQPKRYTENIFSQLAEDTVVDMAAGLIWQRKDNGEPVNRVQADSFIEFLNKRQKSGIFTWRLPTVNELLTLVNDPELPESTCPDYIWREKRDWYWSGDRRSEKTAWFVNTRLGFTGWQNNSCNNYVRAVASIPS